MKKTVSALLAVIIFLSMTIVCSSAEELSQNEQNYIGAWSMCADNGKGTNYYFYIVFMDNMEVVQHSIVYKNGDISSDNKASGTWSGFTDKTIIFTLAGEGMTAMIKDDGYLYTYFFDDKSLCGVFSKCPDMTSALGW
jgi:hypothetical protein